EDGIRDFHVTGVQTCALPIFIDNILARQPDAADGLAPERLGLDDATELPVVGAPRPFVHTGHPILLSLLQLVPPISPSAVTSLSAACIRLQLWPCQTSATFFQFIIRSSSPT